MTYVLDFPELDPAAAAKVAGKSLILAQNAVNSILGNFLLNASSKDEFISRLEYADEIITDVARRRMASVSDSKAKLTKALFAEWSSIQKTAVSYPETIQHGNGVNTIHHDNMNSTVHVDGKPVKKFKGESAWSNAERHGGDLATERMMKSNKWSSNQKKASWDGGDTATCDHCGQESPKDDMEVVGGPDDTYDFCDSKCAKEFGKKNPSRVQNTWVEENLKRNAAAANQSQGSFGKDGPLARRAGSTGDPTCSYCGDTYDEDEHHSNPVNDDHWPEEPGAWPELEKIRSTSANEKPYGSNVPYADPGLSKNDPGRDKFPIDPDHIQAAESYIDHADVKKEYSPANYKKVKTRIEDAADKAASKTAGDVIQGPWKKPPKFKPGDKVNDFHGEGATIHSVVPSFDPSKSHKVHVVWDDKNNHTKDSMGKRAPTAGPYYEEVFDHLNKKAQKTAAPSAPTNPFAPTHTIEYRNPVDKVAPMGPAAGTKVKVIGDSGDGQHTYVQDENGMQHTVENHSIRRLPGQGQQPVAKKTAADGVNRGEHRLNRPNPKEKIVKKKIVKEKPKVGGNPRGDDLVHHLIDGEHRKSSEYIDLINRRRLPGLHIRDHKSHPEYQHSHADQEVM